MKKLLLLSTLLTAASLQAQEGNKSVYYWPSQRATAIESGTQYFIYNTANADGDRSYFLYSDGSVLKTNNVSPASFVTSEDKYLFTANKPENPTDETHWYLNSAHGILGHGGQTNNTEARDIFIAPWFGNDQILKGSAQSEDENGTPQNPDAVNTHVWAIMRAAEKNTDNNDNTYSWNGNTSAAGLGSAWTRWAQAHPYAFYTVESKEIDDQAIAYSQELTNRTGLISEMAFNLQQLYGMVQDGEKYFSNYPETTPAENSSYANLIDGDDNSIFHSSWSTPGTDTDPKHFMRAELTDPKTGFYLVTKRRTSNNNNRPTSILVEGSNDADANYTTLATLTELPTSADEYYYFSDKIANTEGYKYIRFTPQTINTNTRFFTYSEFYLIESTTESDAAIAAIQSLYNDCRDLTVKDDNFESELLAAGNAVMEASNSIALEWVKKEGQSLLDANASNHAADPALGQYPTPAYNALQAVISDGEATAEEIEAAIKTFKFSINAPVFTINGTFTSDAYSTTGKSIYYAAGDNTPLWWNKETNKYDKSMLWKFAGATTTTAGVGTYSVMNMSEDVYFWGVESLQVTATNPTNENGIVLLKTVGNDTPIHADRGGSIVRWNDTNPTSASGWTLAYVGESFDIDQIDEEKLAAYSELKEMITACAPFENKIGDGLNQFTADGLEAALATAEGIVATDFYENTDLDVVPARDALKAAKEAMTINQPETGKFYRIKSVLKEKYVASNQTIGVRPNLVEGTADNTTVFYLSADNRLTAASLCNMNYTAPTSDNLGSKYAFGINNNGYYQITAEGQEAPLYAHNDPDQGDVLTYDFNGGNYADRLANAWILEEVTNADEQITLTKDITAAYATLAAPVALNIPAGIKAYTATVDAAKETAILEEVTDVIPAGTAVILEKEGSETTFEFTFAAEGTTENTNNLVGVYAEKAVAADVNAYVLGNGANGIGFYQMSADDRTMAANKAYLVLPAEASAIRSITIGGATTGIEETVAEDAAQEEYYDLQGRRVMNPTKGIYVTKSGKKVIF